jgi:hypothetical protein
MKRIAIATLFGVIAGVICATGGFYAGILKFSTVMLIWVLLNRAVMGFAIGASGLKLPWAWNGIVVGLVVGSIFSYSLFMTTGPGKLPVLNALVNGVFGFLIELFTTVVFKLPARAKAQALPRAVAA